MHVSHGCGTHWHADVIIPDVSHEAETLRFPAFGSECDLSATRSAGVKRGII